jgi:hypothetical protein
VIGIGHRHYLPLKIKVALPCVFLIASVWCLDCSPKENPEITYDIEDIRRTPSEVRETRTRIELTFAGQGLYFHNEMVHGSLAPMAQETSVTSASKENVSPTKAQALCDQLIKGDFFGLKSDPPIKTRNYVIPDHTEQITVRGKFQKHLEFRTKPQSAARQKLKTAMLDFCHRIKMDQPPFDTSITICTEGDAIRAREVKLEDLIARPSDFHGKRVSVRGFYRWEFEGSDLGIDEDAVNFRQYNRSVWIGEPSSFAHPRQKETVHGAWVRLAGVFKKGPGGHGGLWPGTIDRITQLDVEAPRSTNKK